MTHYYQTFYEDLKLTGKSNRTIGIYEKHLQKIERYYNRSFRDNPFLSADSKQ